MARRVEELRRSWEIAGAGRQTGGRVCLPAPAASQTPPARFSTAPELELLFPGRPFAPEALELVLKIGPPPSSPMPRSI